MNNLFIMHTQYNLILACGIVQTCYQNDRNDLVVYAEFTLQASLKKSLERCFDHVYYIQEHYTRCSNIFKSDYYLYTCLKKSKGFLNNTYQNVFLSQEREYDTYCLAKLAKHAIFNCCAIEEDVYFSVDNARNIPGYKPIKKTIKHNIRLCIRNLCLGRNTFLEENGYFYGMHSCYHQNYVLFPHAVRRELLARDLVEITPNALYKGIQALYSEVDVRLPKSERSVLWYFDLLERYNNLEAITNMVENIVALCENSHITFLYKYHPRETEKIVCLQDRPCVFEIPANLPSEKVSFELKDHNVAVVGNLTTALWVSAKMGMQVFSMVKMENPENFAAAQAMNKMGILTPETFIETEFLLRSWMEA